MKPTVYVILGEGNSRKSSTIRSLTGVGQSKEVDVATSRKKIKVFVQLSSLQESRINPAKFIRKAKREKYKNILVPIWYRSRRSRRRFYPSADQYLREFIKAGWRIRQIVEMNRSKPTASLQRGTPKPKAVPNSTSIPVNQIASMIRKWWGWL